VTSIVREGLADPVPVPGEPHRSFQDPRAPTVGVLQRFDLTVTFPEDWRGRQLVLCGWTAADSFYECQSGQNFREDGVAHLSVVGRDPGDPYELWLSTDASEGLRRLLVIDPTTATWPATMTLAPGFERVNDVLTEQPPAGGNYLVAT
jgi:hypothetical protein